MVARKNTPGRPQNWRGPRRALSLDEQGEVQRLMREARAEHRATKTVHGLARAYGVSSRTIYRYVDTTPVPAGLEYLRMRLAEWNIERQLGLTRDDMVTLMAVIARHRDLHR